MTLYPAGMDGIGRRVREAREAAHLSQAQLADRVGMTQQAIAALEKNSQAKTARINEIARALNVNSDWLEGKTGALRDNEMLWMAPSKPIAALVEVGGTEFARIPVFDIRFAAGAGAENGDESPVAWHTIDLSLLRAWTDAPVSQVAVFRADGDSMEPNIHKGDWVMVDRRRTRLTNPGIYALVHEGDGLLKRASQHLETGAVTLVSDNPAYPPMTLKKPERLQVIGRVFLSITRH